MPHPHPPPPRHPTDRLVGTCPALAALRAQIRHLAVFDTLGNPAVPTVLVQGETGTGKGLVARVLHDSGPRAQGPFLDVNCAAIPETMLEAELFGFEAGAFTDAKRAKPGLFETAAGGTLFLDEIDALPLALQGKLLTAIEAKRVRRVGAVREQAVDIKLVTATHGALSARVAAGQFRADLYYRLAVIVLALSPLRDRGEDVVLLAQQFLQEYARAHQLLPKRLSRAAVAWLQQYDWPGNARELSHLMERVTLLSPEARIDPQTLARLCLPRAPAARHGAASLAEAEDRPLDEAARITQALRQTQGNVVQAARLLGLSRKALRYRMQRAGLARRRDAEQGEGTAEGRDTADPVVSAAAWEQKPVAVLAIEVTWPVARASDTLRYEPWTVHARWEHTVLEKVQGCGGMVLQRGPSLLLAVFGLPHTLEQLPHRAVQTALAIRHMAAEGPDAGERTSQPTVRQAVHWGQVLMDGAARDPTARVLPIAETPAAPVRLLGQAAPGAILVSAPVARLVEGWFEVQAGASPVGEAPDDRAGAYTVLGLRPQRSPLTLHGQRPLSRFVGRARECALFAELLGPVAGGRGHIVGLVGEAGVGKSRLAYELVHSPQTRDWRILESVAVSYGTMTPYFPVIDLLRRYAHVEARDDAHTIQAKVTEQVWMLDAILQDTIPALLALLDALPAEHPFLTLDPPQRRRRILDACKQVLLRESQVQPLLLVFEDLHWIDAETQALLDSLVESLPRVRLLVLVTYRPDYQHGWGSKTYYTQVRLDPLPPDSAGALLLALLGDDSSLVPLKRRLIERTEGNPFFLEESVRTLAETQGLVGEPGAYRLAQPLPTIQMPASVQTVLASRLDRLPPEAKRLLQTAAVIGYEVPLALLEALAEGAEDALHHRLAQLQRAEFLYETRLAPDPVYTFTHALTHEVAYGSLMLERRRALHAQILGVLETLVGDRQDEQVDRLAQHALRGQVWDKTLAYCRQAGAKALAHSAYREAVAYFEQALCALPHLPEQRDLHEQDIDLRLTLRTALTPFGDAQSRQRILALLREAEALAVALGDSRRLGQIYVMLTQYFFYRGMHDQVIATSQRAVALAAASGESVLQALANLFPGFSYQSRGDYRRASNCLGQTVAALDGAQRYALLGLTSPPALFARALLVLCHAELGTFAAGRALGEAGLQFAEALAHPYTLSYAYYGLGLLCLRQGDLSRALPLLERAVDISRDADIPANIPRMGAALGAAYTLAGRIADAVPLLTQAREQSVATGRAHQETLCSLPLGEAHLLDGRMEEAHALAERALAHARESQERGHEAYALRLLGDIAAQRELPDSKQAETRYRHALALAEELGMRPLQAHCHRGLGMLSAEIGGQELARTALSTALALYRAMDMLLWVPQTEAAMAQVEREN